MSLAILITSTDLEVRVGDADRLMQYANGSDERIDEAIRVANSEFEMAAKRWFTDVSVEALTPATLAAAVKGWLVSRALDILTQGGEGRPDEFQRGGDESMKQFSLIATGNVPIPGLVSRSSGTNSSGGVSYRSQARAIDSCDPNSDYNIRNRKI